MNESIDTAVCFNNMEPEQFKKNQLDDIRKTPVLNGPATLCHWTDTSACEVVAINKTGTRVTLRVMKSTLLNGVGSGEEDELVFSPGGFVGHTSGTQRYKLEPDPNGSLHKASRRVRKDGKVVWKLVGHGTYSPGGSVYFGEANKYYDFNF